MRICAKKKSNFVNDLQISNKYGDEKVTHKINIKNMTTTWLESNENMLFLHKLILFVVYNSQYCNGK